MKKWQRKTITLLLGSFWSLTGFTFYQPKTWPPNNQLVVNNHKPKVVNLESQNKTDDVNKWTTYENEINQSLKKTVGEKIHNLLTNYGKLLNINLTNTFITVIKHCLQENSNCQNQEKDQEKNWVKKMYFTQLSKEIADNNTIKKIVKKNALNIKNILISLKNDADEKVKKQIEVILSKITQNQPFTKDLFEDWQTNCPLYQKLQAKITDDHITQITNAITQQIYDDGFILLGLGLSGGLFVAFLVAVIVKRHSKKFWVIINCSATLLFGSGLIYFLIAVLNI